MSRVRLIGPLARLPDVTAALQDYGELHPARAPSDDPLLHPNVVADRSVRTWRRALAAVEAAIESIPVEPVEAPASLVERRSRGWIAARVREARGARRSAVGLNARIAGLRHEDALLARYDCFLGRFASLAANVARRPDATVHLMLLEPTSDAEISRIRAVLADWLGTRFELQSERLGSGDVALSLLLPPSANERVEQVLASAGVTELPLPASLAGHGPDDILTALRARQASIAVEIEQASAGLRRLRAERARDLLEARAWLMDRLGAIDAERLAAATAHAFVLEGWVPRASVPRLREAIDSRFGGEVVLEERAREEWAADEAPVVLRNPRLFRPFESIARLLPAPRYGTIDPTPFVAVFFPMFFGLILGDVGYGAALAILAGWLHHRSKPDTLTRTLAEIAGPCAAFTIVFGMLFGEFLGTAGRSLGMRPLLFDRGDALLPFLALALAIGAVHILLGLLLRAIAALREGPRRATGPGAMLGIVGLILVGFMAAAGVLPRTFFSPAVIGVLVLFPVLVIVEGFVAPIELLSTLGHILSYARVMALGTASVMMAIAANRMVGAAGGIVVGVLFALLFHLVNFAIGLFSPTIHALRLHYVEFFGTFYSPGGIPYRPLRHWKPASDRAGG